MNFQREKASRGNHREVFRPVAFLAQANGLDPFDGGVESGNDNEQRDGMSPEIENEVPVVGLAA